jgi:hypothetical protein
MAATAIDKPMAWRQDEELRQMIMAEIRHELPGSFFRFIDVEDAEVLWIIPTGRFGWVCVVGHPEHGSYEWVAHSEPSYVPQLGHEIYTRKRYEFSDCGYGDSAAALRDGLVKMLS